MTADELSRLQPGDKVRLKQTPPKSRFTYMNVLDVGVATGTVFVTWSLEGYVTNPLQIFWFEACHLERVA